MPRKIRDPDGRKSPRRPELIDALAGELKSGREFGQPIIEEEHFKTGAVRVVVIWDRWDDVPEDVRANVIADAYRRAEGEDFANRIALIGGYTIPEAYASGMLPFQVMPALRPGDAVTPEQCHRAMIDQGASLLFDPKRPQLRFGTEEEAAACLKRLVERLPESEHVWQVTEELGRILESSWDVS